MFVAMAPVRAQTAQRLTTCQVWTASTTVAAKTCEVTIQGTGELAASEQGSSEVSTVTIAARVVTFTAHATNTGTATYLIRDAGTTAEYLIDVETVKAPERPTITIEAGDAVTEGDPASYTVTSNVAPAAALTVDLTVSDGDGEFVATSDQGEQTVEIAADATSATFTVATVGDDTGEAHGEVTVTIAESDADPKTYTVGSDNSAMVTVNDDDWPTISIEGGDSVVEGRAATFTITTDPAVSAGESLEVKINVVDAAGSDFVDAGDEGEKVVTIVAEATSATYMVYTDGDSSDEPSGSVTVNVVAGDYHVDSDKGSAMVTVRDNDAAPVDPTLPTVSISGGNAVTEGGHVNFLVSVDEAQSSALTVSYVLNNAAGSNFVNVGRDGYAGTAVIPSGQTSVWTSFPTVDDSVDEANGAVTATLSADARYNISGDGMARVAVNDNDAAPVTPTDPEDLTIKSVKFDDSDAVVKSGTPVKVTVTTEHAIAGTMVKLTVPTTGLSISTSPSTTTQSHVLRVPSSGANANKVTFDLITVGAPNGDYVLSVVADQDGNFATLTDQVAAAAAATTLTLGDTGTNVSSVSLSLARTVERKASAGVTAIAKRHAVPNETKVASSPETASAGASQEIYLSAAVLNSLGKAANANGLTAISISAPGATIQQYLPNPDALRANPTATVAKGRSSSHTLTLSNLTASAVAFTVTKATAGTVDVSVSVVGKDGLARSESLTLTFTGSTAEIALADAAETLLNHYIDHDADGDGDDTDTDGRDNVVLLLTSSDKAGNATLPTNEPIVTITDPDGVQVEANKLVVSTSRTALTTTIAVRVHEGVKITKPLASGEYTVKAASGTLSDTATFTVAGKTASIELSADDMAPSAIGQSVTVTATLTDADGNPVADGTEVTFTPTGSNAGVPVANRTGVSGALKTKGGEVTATFVIATSGPAIISAVADGKSATVVLASSAGADDSAMADEEASVACLSNLNGFATWTCSVESSASEIFGLVSGRGATAIHLWNGSAWVRYSVVDGTMVPGSSDFMVAENDILYISN